MTLSDKTEARRFINFIDTLYDNKVFFFVICCIVIDYFGRWGWSAVRSVLQRSYSLHHMRQLDT